VVMDMMLVLTWQRPLFSRAVGCLCWDFMLFDLLGFHVG